VIHTAQKLARTVRIEPLEQGPIKLQIAEVEVLGRTDESPATIHFALHRPALQSSYDDGDPASASRAVDGKSNKDCKLASTQSEARPWWEVDLGKYCRIEEIRIWGPNDPKDKSLNNIRVCLLDRPSDTKSPATGDEKQKKSLPTNLKLFFKKVFNQR
jgi:endo-beta-N-acetylglucosaminidase D